MFFIVGFGFVIAGFVFVELESLPSWYVMCFVSDCADDDDEAGCDKNGTMSVTSWPRWLSIMFLYYLMSFLVFG